MSTGKWHTTNRRAVVLCNGWCFAIVGGIWSRRPFRAAQNVADGIIHGSTGAICLAVRVATSTTDRSRTHTALTAHRSTHANSRDRLGTKEKQATRSASSINTSLNINKFAFKYLVVVASETHRQESKPIYMPAKGRCICVCIVRGDLFRQSASAHPCFGLSWLEWYVRT